MEIEKYQNKEMDLCKETECMIIEEKKEEKRTAKSNFNPNYCSSRRRVCFESNDSNKKDTPTASQKSPLESTRIRPSQDRKKSKLKLDLSDRGETENPRCGPSCTFKKYQVLFRTVESMGVKNKRDIFKITRKNDQLNEHWFFPHYGITAGEFAFCNILFENYKKWQWESSYDKKTTLPSQK